jgi:hypothetical protein
MKFEMSHKLSIMPQRTAFRKTAFKRAISPDDKNLQKMLKHMSVKKEPKPEKHSDVPLVANLAFSIDQLQINVDMQYK